MAFHHILLCDCFRGVSVFPNLYSWKRARLMSNMSTSTSAGQVRGQVSVEQLATRGSEAELAHIWCVGGGGGERPIDQDPD